MSCTKPTGRVTRRKAPLAAFAVFAANYQPSTSRSRRKSWTADGLAHARTASASAVLALFSAVLVGKNPRTAKGALPSETGSLRRVIDSPYPHRYHSKGSLSILINAMFLMSTGQGASLDTPGAATIESSPHARAMGRSQAGRSALALVAILIFLWAR